MKWIPVYMAIWDWNEQRQEIHAVHIVTGLNKHEKCSQFVSLWPERTNTRNTRSLLHCFWNEQTLEIHVVYIVPGLNKHEKCMQFVTLWPEWMNTRNTHGLSLLIRMNKHKKYMEFVTLQQTWEMHAVSYTVTGMNGHKKYTQFVIWCVLQVI